MPFTNWTFITNISGTGQHVDKVFKKSRRILEIFWTQIIGEGPQISGPIFFKIAHISNHVAKFCDDLTRHLRDLAC